MKNILNTPVSWLVCLIFGKVMKFTCLCLRESRKRRKRGLPFRWIMATIC